MTFHSLLIISMFTQKPIKIIHSEQEIRPISLFQNLALGTASTDNKCHFAIVSLFSEFEPRQNLDQSLMSFDNSWATSCQYTNVYAKFHHNIPLNTNRPGTKSSQTVQGQNLHKLSGDKIKCLIIRHSMKFNFKFQLTFLGSCNFIS